MNTVEFYKGMEILSDFYAKSLQDKTSEIWWSKLRFLDYQVFLKAIDMVTSHERQMPTPAIVLNYASEAKDSQKPSKIGSEPGRIDCSMCNSRGMVTAIHKAENGCEYDTAFRCPQCRNWEGRMSDKIPIWSSEFRKKNYYLQNDTQDSAGSFSEKAKRLTQKLFSKTTSSVPDDLDLEEVEKGLEKDPRKEKLREYTLDQDRSRDSKSLNIASTFQSRKVH